MSMTDPIADMLTRIRNGNKAKFEKVDIPLSKEKLEIAKILKQEGYIKNFKVLSEEEKGTLRVYLKYDAQNRGIINGIKRVSRPGLRIYVKSKKILPVLNGFGINIVSTPQGIITDKDAKKLNVGGELICSVW
ncbi:MAG: 30S ribosomal protein S8 [Thermodesulfobacteriota bacterium]|jgi:small subunit ribosomal protein S8|nr:MAG: 30S ribosomal protein S8 [Thermodesulfobacteriota bacterium]